MVIISQHTMKATVYLTCIFMAFCYHGYQEYDISCPYGCDCIRQNTDLGFFCNSTNILFHLSEYNIRLLHLVDIKKVRKLSKRLLVTCENLIIDKAIDVEYSESKDILVNPTFVSITNSDLNKIREYFVIGFSYTKKVYFENVTQVDTFFIRTWLRPALTSLTVIKSPIKSIDLGSLNKFPNLKSLVLRHAQICGTLSPNLVGSKLKKLEYLDLSYNHISAIQGSMFKNMPSLKTLKLNNNHLVGISWNTVKPIWNNLQEFWLT
ncbi:hypothetical protein B4U80_11976, partial [Leptotrombidium deliense]